LVEIEKRAQGIKPNSIQRNRRSAGEAQDWDVGELFDAQNRKRPASRMLMIMRTVMTMIFTRLMTVSPRFWRL